MSATIFSDTPWHDAAAHPDLDQLSPLLKRWLLDPGSLTERLQRHAHSFQVDVQHHGAGPLTADEHQAIAPWHEHNSQCREVLLCDAQTPLVFARSVIPTAPDGLLHALQHIGDSPLGEALFTHPEVTTGAFELAHFPVSSQIGVLNQRLTGISATIWGRRRNFYVAETPVLVAEVFLSTAPCYK